MAEATPPSKRSRTGEFTPGQLRLLHQPVETPGSSTKKCIDRLFNALEQSPLPLAPPLFLPAAAATEPASPPRAPRALELPPLISPPRALPGTLPGTLPALFSPPRALPGALFSPPASGGLLAAPGLRLPGLPNFLSPPAHGASAEPSPLMPRVRPLGQGTPLVNGPGLLSPSPPPAAALGAAGDPAAAAADVFPLLEGMAKDLFYEGGHVRPSANLYAYSLTNEQLHRLVASQYALTGLKMEAAKPLHDVNIDMFQTSQKNKMAGILEDQLVFLPCAMPSRPCEAW